MAELKYKINEAKRQSKIYKNYIIFHFYHRKH